MGGGSAREREWFRGRFRVILSAVGIMWAMSSALMLVPLLFPGSSQSVRDMLVGFLAPGLAGMTIGWFLHSQGRGLPQDLTLAEGAVIVVISWLIVCCWSALPFLLLLPVSASQAMFESVSGWTTTGLSILRVETVPESLLLWRSLMQFFGGAGLVIVLLGGMAQAGGRSLSMAEGHSDQLVPNVQKSARYVLALYSAYLVFGTLACNLAGMDLFPALNHAMAAISTGGFSTVPDSVGTWDNPYLEAILIVLMLLGNFNFVLVWQLLQGEFRAFFRSGEIRLQLVLIPLVSALLWGGVCVTLYPTLSKSVRVACFETVTALTTTGFSTVSYSSWNDTAVALLIILMIIGGGACSTAGGLKQDRVHIMVRSIGWEIRRWVSSPLAVASRSIWENGRPTTVSDERIAKIGTFMSLYLGTLALGTLILLAHGYPFRDALFEFSSALGTVGLSLGRTGPDTPTMVLWTQTAGMILGRLEFGVALAGGLLLIQDSRKLI